MRAVPSFALDTEEAIYNVTVFQSKDVRTVVRASLAGKPIERMRVDRLRAKIAPQLPDA
jgi:hypothetical protein